MNPRSAAAKQMMQPKFKIEIEIEIGGSDDSKGAAKPKSCKNGKCGKCESCASESEDAEEGEED